MFCFSDSSGSPRLGRRLRPRSDAWVLAGLSGLVLLLLSGCDWLQDRPTDPGEPVSYEWIKKADGLHVREAQTRVFRDNADWVQFWNEYISLFDENHQLYPPTSIDFNQRIVIAVFWGAFTGGAEIRSTP